MKIAHQIFLLCSLFLAALTLLAWRDLRSTGEQKIVVDEMRANAACLLTTSRLIDHLQKERAIDIVPATPKELQAFEWHRGELATRIDQYRRSTQSAVIESARIEEAEKQIAALEPLLAKKQALDAPARELLDKSIATLMRVESAIANARTTRGVGKLINSILLVELAKEDAAQLRRIINSPSDSDRQSVARLRWSVEEKLTSPVLVFSSESLASFQAVLHAEDWRSVQAALDTPNAAAIPARLDAVTRALDLLLKREIDAVVRRVNELLREAASDYWLSISAIAACGLVVIFAAIKMTRRITQPVQRAAEFARAVGDGDLSQRLNFRTDDEIGRLGQALDAMTDRLDETLSTLTGVNTERLQAQEKLRRLFERSADAMILAEGDTILDCNPAAVRLMGFETRDALMQAQLSRFSPEHQPDGRVSSRKAENMLAAAFIFGRNLFEWEHRRPNGPPFIGEVSLTPFIVDGREQYFRVWRDITERKRAEERLRESEAQYRDLVQSANSIILRWNTEGRVVFMNRYGLRFFGYDEGMAVGNTFLRTIAPPASTGGLKELIAEICANPERQTINENECVGRGGERFWISWVNKPIHDARGNVIEILSIGYDATERKAAERQLEQARDAAEAASKSKSEFLANMSHELRTPLNGVIGMVELLLDTATDSQQRRYAQLAKSSADLLLDVVNDILDLSKIEAGKLELEDIDFELEPLVESVALVLAHKADEKGVELACSVDPLLNRPLKGDPGRIRQILVNLAGNAVKFTERGEVSISASLEAFNDQSVLLRFIIRDTGIGIPPERVGRLFQSFSQVDASTTRRYGGTGLGLAISKNLVELMNGMIGVESEVGKGSKFWFTVRCAHGTKRELPATPRAPALQRLRVLAVDDNSTNRQILQRQLSHHGMECSTAPDGPAALQQLRGAQQLGRPFQLAILDMHLPEMDGSQLAQAIRGDPDLRATVLVLLSSVGYQPNADRMKTMGFDACATKPLWRAQLLDVLAAALNREPGRPPAQSDTGAYPRLAQNSNSRVRVLLVEDNEINQDVAAGFLTKAGYSFEVAGDGRTAVEAVVRRRFDVVLMDCQIPEIDGFEATRRIRELEREGKLPGGHGRRLPIIALTASALKGDRDRCLSAGMDEYLTKPLDSSRLIQTLETLLSKRPAGGSGFSSAVVSAVRTDPLPSLNLPELLGRCQQDVSFAHRILVKFRELSTTYVEQIERDARGTDAAQLAASAHAFKGAAANVSALLLQQAAAQVEEAARTSGIEHARTHLIALRTELHRCHDHIQRVTASPVLTLAPTPSAT